jgi:hypothetical protein
MVNVSLETPEATETRLLRVIREATLVVYPRLYAFLEFPMTEFPNAVRPDALALVRDDQVWCQLVPCDDATEELFGLFRFHFPADADNSGFVGWLATRLKRQFGTGVFVTCGQNSQNGGIYDYWGIPSALAHDVTTEITRMVRGQR